MTYRTSPADARRTADDPRTPAALRALLTETIKHAGPSAPRPTTSHAANSPTSRADALCAEFAEQGLFLGGGGAQHHDAAAVHNADALLAELAEQNHNLDSTGASARADALLAEFEELGLGIDGARRKEAHQ
jgi:hypothetical protein